ncbi:partial Sensor histidine kinase LiaS, partial [Anaerolineae bacterium]
PIDNHLPPCSYAWAYLILPLHVGEQVIGLWFLGQHDPDDVYARAEVNVLLALANQTAIALAHLVQSERLRIAYKADVDRMEAERTSLARELHDHVLGDLAALKVAVETSAVPSTFLDIYERVTTSLRQTITELRPTMLNYGLHAALISLADALDDHAPNDLVVALDIPETNVRYDVGLEQHLYRIVQQACENTLQHAHAHQLCLKGQLQPEHIDLTIEDDGVGFETSGQLDLAELISRRHFGLAGVYERATLIQAQLFIDSAPQRGTRVRIVWEA